MYCTTCGQQLSDAAKFCLGCGNTVTPVAAVAPANTYDIPGQQTYYVEDEISLLGRMTDAQRSLYTIKRKDPTVSLLLCLFLGGLGAHHFYLGNTVAGILCIVFSWTLIPLLASLVDLFFVMGRTRRHNLALAHQILQSGSPSPSYH